MIRVNNVYKSYGKSPVLIDVTFKINKGEVVVVLLDAAVTMPITLKMDDIRVIRREGQEENQ